jgi:ribosomal protein S18 acetylase RimI-like enzyme
MTTTTIEPTIAIYTHRLASVEDAKAIAPLWAAFATERAAADPSMVLKPNFDFEKYVANQLNKPLSYCFLLEYKTSNSPQIVGCIFIYFYDEAPPPLLPAEMLEEHEQENPFMTRRVGSVLGMYVEPEHRQPEAIQLIANAAIQKAEEMQVSDIDLLIAADQTGIQALLKRAGFTQAAVQFTKHYKVANNAELPSLHIPHPELDLPEPPTPGAMPLRDPQTNELVYNSQGEPVFIYPLTDDSGELLKTVDGLPIYPTPLRDPQTDGWVFDAEGELAVCPVLLDDSGDIFQCQGIPQFCPPVYEFVGGKIGLKRDESGAVVFSDVERNQEGKIVRNPQGQPVFKQLINH